MNITMLVFGAIFVALGVPLAIGWWHGAFEVFWTTQGAALVQMWGSAAACLWGAWGLIEKCDSLRAERDEARKLYHDLIMQVEQKVPYESRHDTARRYIHDAEHQDHAQESEVQKALDKSWDRVNAALNDTMPPNGQAQRQEARRADCPLERSVGRQRLEINFR